MYNGNGNWSAGRSGMRIPPIYIYVAVGIAAVLLLSLVGGLLSAGMQAYFALAVGALLILGNLRDLLPSMVPSPGAALMNVLVQGFPYILLFTMLWLSSRWERDVIRTYLADEVGISVTPEEYARIARYRLFGDTRWFRGREARIANAQNELAFRKWHVAREGGDPNTDPLVAAWREDIAALREE